MRSQRSAARCAAASRPAAAGSPGAGAPRCRARRATAVATCARSSAGERASGGARQPTGSGSRDDQRASSSNSCSDSKLCSPSKGSSPSSSNTWPWSVPSVRPQSATEMPSVRCSEASAHASAPAVLVACTKPAGTNRLSPGRSHASTRGSPSSAWSMMSSPLPLWHGCASALLATDSGLKTRHRFSPCTWRMSTSWWSEWAGVEMERPGAVA
mmetsp:Transcript_4115/g.13068  ORF Transcript_4115/g.13068 Transcript_4115/m.13068 type:complete len:213 (+) Transcript_4115:401-1039(+)